MSEEQSKQFSKGQLRENQKYMYHDWEAALAD